MYLTWKRRSSALCFDLQNGHPVLCSVEHVIDSSFMCFGMGMTLPLSHFKVTWFNLSRICTFLAIFLSFWTKLCTWTTHLFFWLMKVFKFTCTHVIKIMYWKWEFQSYTKILPQYLHITSKLTHACSFYIVIPYTYRWHNYSWNLLFI